MNEQAIIHVFKYCWLAISGAIGFLIGELAPTFPLIIVAILFILYDAYSAYKLDKRVHEKYPDRTKRHEAKFNSFCFGKVVRQTIPEMIGLIILAFVCEKYVIAHYDWHLEYVTTGIICGWQALSIVENMASCNDSQSRFWLYLKKVLVSKVERHLDEAIDDALEIGGEKQDEGNNT